MNYTKTLSYTWGAYTLYGVGALFVCFILLYVTLVFKTVSFTAYRQHAHTDIREINARVSELESQYIALKNKVTPEVAADLGFKEVSTKRYISKPSLGLSR